MIGVLGCKTGAGRGVGRQTRSAVDRPPSGAVIALGTLSGRLPPAPHHCQRPPLILEKVGETGEGREGIHKHSRYQ